MRQKGLKKYFSLNGVTIIVFLLSLPFGLMVISPVIINLILIYIDQGGGFGYIAALFLIPITIVSSIPITILARKAYLGSKIAGLGLLVLIALFTILYFGVVRN